MKKQLCFLALIPGLIAVAESNTTPVPGPFKYSVDASFTYWYAKEDGLNVAESAILVPLGRTLAPPNATVFKQDSGYKPGFKVGIGMESSNHWDLHAEYTYFRGSTTTSKAAPSNTSDLTAIGIWNLDDWFLQTTPFTEQSIAATHLSSTWKLGMDLGDLTVSRPYMKDRGFCFSPFGGLRTVWFRQHMNINATQAAGSIGGSGFLLPQPLQSRNSSNAWALGPRIGTEGKYGLPMGFRLDGLVAASLLYTQFTSVKHYEGRAATFMRYPLQTSMNNYNCVRPVIDVNLGLGWGMKFCQKYEVDLAASYDFSYFWGQNMMRSMMDEFWGGTASGNLDLYFQGLTITAGFKF